MNTKNRRLAVAAWVYALGGAAVALVTVWFGSTTRNAVFTIAMIALFPALWHATRANRLPARYALALSLIGLLYAAEAVMTLTWSDITVVANVLDLVATAIILAVVVALLDYQRGGLRSGDVADGIIIGAGGWLIAWVVLIQPYIDGRDQSVVSLVLNGLYLPLTLVLLSMTVILLFGAGRPSFSLLALAAGLTTNVMGDMVYALGDIGDVGPNAIAVADGLYIVTVCACAGAFLHPSSRRITTRSSKPSDMPLPGRLTLISTSLFAPIVLIALIPSDTVLDRAVRAVSAVALLGLVAVRFASATRSQLHAQVELEATVRTDELTALPNKRALFELAEEAIADRWKTDSRPSLYLFDLDGFKNVNDSYGHAVGDRVLEMVSRRLLEAAHVVGATTTRVSGDEFVVFDPTPVSREHALSNAQALMLAFEEALPTTVGQIFINSSCGVACMPADSTATCEDLFRWADIAMYRAKDAGRNRVVLYEAAMQEHVTARMDIEIALRGALQRGELSLHHQPIVNISTGRVTGLEALMRWEQADGTKIPPDVFIPIAEETGMIHALGSWALVEALGQLRSWIDDRVVSPDTTMSVNVSPRQLTDPRFAAGVESALRSSNVPAKLLWLELTESVLVENADATVAVLGELTKSGVGVALDDFGTGYSSLSMLQKMPIQRVKIDRSFISSIDTSDNDRSLVRTIVGLAELMGLDVVAEGVESVSQLRLLRDLGCDNAQGYLISRPAPADAMRSTIESLANLSRQSDFGHLLGDALLPTSRT